MRNVEETLHFLRVHLSTPFQPQVCHSNEHSIPIAEFKKDLDSQCGSVYQAMEGMFYHMYSKSSKNIDNKLQELFATLERIGEVLLTASTAISESNLYPNYLCR